MSNEIDCLLTGLTAVYESSVNCLFIAYAHFSLVFLSDLSAFHVENVNARGANVNLLFMVSGFHVALTVSAAQGFTEWTPDGSRSDLCSTWRCVVCGVKSGFIFLPFYVGICLSSGCHNKILQAGVLNSMYLFLRGLEVRSLRSGCRRLGSW